MVRKIRELCKSKGISLKELENELELGYRTIEQWDTHSPSVKKVLKVSEYFGVTVDSLLEDEKNP